MNRNLSALWLILCACLLPAQTVNSGGKSIDYAAIARKYGGQWKVIKTEPLPPATLPPDSKDWDEASPFDPETNFAALCKELYADADIAKIPPGAQATPLRAAPAVDQDYAQGVFWCRRAADKGNAWAQMSLGFMYQKGLGVAHDNVQAAEWYGKAVDGGWIGEWSWEALDKEIEVEDAIGVAKKERRAKELRIAGIAVGLCVLAVGLWLGVRYREKITPRTSRGKQSLVLLPVALWCSACCLHEAWNPVAMRHPIDALATALLLSMPALLLGAVGLWMVSGSNPAAEPENWENSRAIQNQK